MCEFTIGFIGIHTGIDMGVYRVVPTVPLSLIEFNSMIHIIRTQLLGPIQADCEDFRLYPTLYQLQDMFAESATVTICESITRSNSDMSIRILGSDSQDIIFHVWEHHVELREEGSHTILEELFQDMGIM